jgi:hypothetical protein
MAMVYSFGKKSIFKHHVCNPIIKSIASASPYNHHMIIHVKLAQYVWLLV